MRDQAIWVEPVGSAILVPDTRIAYLSRIAFGHAGEANYRVFYNDFGAALKWLEEGRA